jgi:type IV pilus assembly protein PilP
MSPLKFLLAAAACMVLLTVTACSSSSDDALQSWMTEQRSKIKSQIKSLPEPTKFLPEAYTSDALLEPFSSEKLAQALKRDSNQSTVNAALIAPELARRKEPLESFPLDAVVMVGSLIKVNQPVALIRVDNLLYQVKLGNYLGQNFGRVNMVSETSIVLREIVQDAAGEWVERAATLQLQEGSK